MQISRLFEIVYILLENKMVTAKTLSEKFEVSTRTIYRDIETLSQSGIPVYMSKGKNGGISLLPDFILNKAVITDEEKDEILSSLKAVSIVNPLDKGTAFSKLSSLLGNTYSDWVEVDFSSWGNFKNDSDYFNTLKSAIIDKYEITFDYINSKNEITKRSVLPLRLVFKSHGWYLYGFCNIRQDMRFFKFHRINNLSVTDRHFDMVKKESVIENSSVDTDNYIEAVFRISDKMSFRVIDEFRQYEKDNDGFYICKAKLPDLYSVCGYALSFGEYCTIISPHQARDKMKEILNKSLNNYL